MDITRFKDPVYKVVKPFIINCKEYPVEFIEDDFLNITTDGTSYYIGDSGSLFMINESQLETIRKNCVLIDPNNLEQLTESVETPSLKSLTLVDVDKVMHVSNINTLDNGD